MNAPLHPKDHAERVALFRAQVLGPVLNRDLYRGELLAELRALAKRRWRPPGSDRTRTFSVPTLLRWHRRYRAQGLAGLRPVSRRLGDGLALTEEQRTLLLEIRRQNPAVAANTILQTLELDGRLEPGQVSTQTLRRLYRRHGLPRRARAQQTLPGERRRWEAEHVGELWHADVCHGATLVVGSSRTPVRIHALLDDKSRYVLALRVLPHEREVAMLDLLLEAVRLYGVPKRLYLDNGATYRGEALSTACGRLGIGLSHAKAYDPQARGKMERFWRTLRQGCLDLMGQQSSLHDIQVRLSTFLSMRYHKAAHASLVGRSPAQVWANRSLVQRTGDQLVEALTVRQTRKVRKDCTLTVGNVDWEVVDAFLAGKRVTVARTLADPQHAPWVEYDDRVWVLRLVDAVANGRRPRRRPKPGVDAVDFDPVDVMLDHAMGRSPRRPAGGGR
ncbi:MAG: DDE-type integrase/transposase/recombinase [Candidatus Limnocylindrales bacterium]